MYIDISSLNFVLIVVAIFWLLFISVFAISLLLGDRSDEKISKGFEQLRKELESQTKLFLDTANKDSHTLVQDAITRSAAMENDTRRILGENHAQFTAALEQLSSHQLELLHKSSDELSKAYQLAITKEKDQIISSFHSTAEELGKTLLVDFNKFQDELNSRTSLVQKDLDAKSEETYKKIKDEMELYKKERLEKFETTIMQILEDVATKAFGKVISLQDHKDFVLKALDQAKKENGINK